MHSHFLPFGEHHVAVRVIHSILNVIDRVSARSGSKVARAPANGVWRICHLVVLATVALLANGQVIESRHVIPTPNVV